MKLDAVKFGLAAAYAVAVIWVLCVIVVLLLPGMSMSMGGYMMHADFTGMTWHMGFLGLVFGLILWAGFTGFFAYLLAAIYNRLL